MSERTPLSSAEPAPRPAAGTGGTRPSTSARRGRPGYDQQSVLRIAVDVFNRHGYEATSMGTLADELGISKSAIYHHVPGKEELLRLALDRALGGLEAVLEEPGTLEGTADERLEHVVRRTVGVLTEELPFVTLLLRLRGNTEMERQALERRRLFDRRIAGLVAEASREGSVRDDVEARVVTRLLFGTINSIVEWYRPGGPLSAEDLADDVVAILFDGLHGRRGRVARRPTGGRTGDGEGARPIGGVVGL